MARSLLLCEIIIKYPKAMVPQLSSEKSMYQYLFPKCEGDSFWETQRGLKENWFVSTHPSPKIFLKFQKRISQSKNFF